MWARLEASAHDALRATMFTPVTAAAAQRCLQARSLGVARLRLLPKRDGALAAHAPRAPSQAPDLSLGPPAVGGSSFGSCHSTRTGDYWPRATRPSMSLQTG